MKKSTKLKGMNRIRGAYRDLPFPQRGTVADGQDAGHFRDSGFELTGLAFLVLRHLRPRAEPHPQATAASIPRAAINLGLADSIC
jgi:hypothetical protein